MKFIIQSLLVGLTLIKGKILKLMIITIMAGLFSLAMIGIVQNFLGANDVTLPIAVLNLDSDTYMETILNTALKNDMITDLFTVYTVDSQSEGESMVQEGQAMALIIFPDGFVRSVMNGTNLSPQVELSSQDPVYQMVIGNLVDSLAQVMVQTQSGIYASIDVMKEQGLYSDDFILPINMEYVMFFLESEGIYEEDNISYTQTLSLTAHYKITILLFLVILSTGLFLPELNAGYQIAMLRQMATVRSDYPIFYFGRVASIYLVYLALFVGITLVMGQELQPLHLFALSQGVLLLILVQSLIATLCKQFMAANQVHCVIHGASWVLCGGILPPLFLPSVASKLGSYTPFYQLFRVFQGIYFWMDWDAYGCTGLLLWNVILIGVLCWLVVHRVRGGALDEDIR